MSEESQAFLPGQVQQSRRYRRSTAGRDAAVCCGMSCAIFGICCAVTCFVVTLVIGISIWLAIDAIFLSNIFILQYTAESKLTISLEGMDPPRSYHQMVYSDGTKWAVEMGENFTSREVHDGYNFAIVSQYFDHQRCHLLKSNTASTQAITVLNILCKKKDIKCPNDEKTKCKEYRLHNIEVVPGVKGSIAYVFEKKTMTPVQISAESDIAGKVSFINDFISFKKGVPDAKHFELPPKSKCWNFRDSVSNDAEKSVETENEIAEDQLLNSAEHIRSISERAVEWEAGENSFFDGHTFSSARTLLSQEIHSAIGQLTFPLLANSVGNNEIIGENQLLDSLNEEEEIPEEFDAREHWKNCTTISTVLDQDKCGCCYAMAAATTLSDRFCIHSNAEINEMLSTQYIVNCYQEDLGCSGGHPDLTWKQLVKSGTPKRSCMSYLGVDHKCTDTCDDGSLPVFFKSRNAYSVYVEGNTTESVEAIQREIMTNGPMEASFYVFDDFTNYVSGVYSLTIGSRFLGGHAVRLIGWGTSYYGTPYWLVANSWGTKFGYDGVFKIKRGTNEVGFEDGLAAGMPYFN